jgi:hypothetical protein
MRMCLFFLYLVYIGIDFSEAAAHFKHCKFNADFNTIMVDIYIYIYNDLDWTDG